MRLKSVTKTKTLILAALYDSHYYRETYTNANFINACLQLKNEWPDLFTILNSEFSTITIKVNDGKLKHVFDLYKYNEDKVILKTRSKSC